MDKGISVRGKIIQSEKRPRGKFEIVKLLVEFNNLSGTTIQEELRFVDSKPFERRYENGNSVSLRIDLSKGAAQNLKLDGGQTVIGKSFILISAVLLSGAIYGTYFLYQLTNFRIQGKLENISLLFEKNESMPMLGLIFLGVLIFQYFLFNKIGLLSKHIIDDLNKELKYKGKRAVANIQRYEDTGVSINDNPKVRFYYAFSTEGGTVIQGKDELVIGKLDIGRLPDMKEKNVIYLPENPNQSLLEENLKNNNLKGCLNLMIILQALIFSAIIIGNYVYGIL